MSAATVKTNERMLWSGLGDFCNSVANATLARGSDAKMMAFEAAASEYGSHSTGADGGFAVPPSVGQDIWKGVMVKSIAAKCAQLEINSNTTTLPVDVEAPWSTTGVQVERPKTGDVLTASKPKLDARLITLKRLAAYVPVSSELLDDAPGLEDYLTREAVSRISYQLDREIISGSGVHESLGVLSAPGTLMIDKESGQSANSLITQNITNAYERLVP